MLSYMVHTASSYMNPWNRSPSSACSSQVVRSYQPNVYYPTANSPELTEDQAGSLIDRILGCPDLYAVLGVGRSARSEELRRAYMGLCRQCHPDKLPNEPRATNAFQRLSFAYSVLSDPRTRNLYDTKKLDDTLGSRHNGDETLNQVLQAVWGDFLDGDFEVIRVILRSINEANPALELGDEEIEAVIHALVNLREVVVSGQRHLRLIKFELMRLYEIQHTLRQLSYFDIPGRLKLSIQLARLTIALPVNVDKAIMAAQRDVLEQPEGEIQLRRGRYLPSSIHSVIGLACSVLETGERVIPSRA